jgi:hypothetical protein
MDRFLGEQGHQGPYVAGMGTRGRTGAFLNELDGILTALERGNGGNGRAGGAV